MSGGLQITILARKPDDELLLLASDGLWDVLTNQEACSLAKRCLRRARQRGATRQSAARIAATVLTRAAVDRGSRDNVTVVVVDLMSGTENSYTCNCFMLCGPAQGTAMFCNNLMHCSPADVVNQSCGTHLSSPSCPPAPPLLPCPCTFTKSSQAQLPSKCSNTSSVYILAREEGYYSLLCSDMCAKLALLWSMLRFACKMRGMCICW